MRTNIIATVAGAVIGAVLAAASLGATAPAARAQAPWPSAGASVENTHALLTREGPNQLNARTAKLLKLKWTVVTAGDVSATPTVEPGALYVPDWGGMLYKLNPTTGAVIWKHKVSDYTGDSHSKSRSSPAIVGDLIIIGDMSVARVIAVNKISGKLAWVTRVDSNGDAFASTSPTVYGGIVYFGIASREETIQHPPSGGFRGSVVALNVNTGALLWKFITVPQGYTGGAVVAPPVVDKTHNTLFIAADNNYSVPDKVAACFVAAKSSYAKEIACMDPSNYVDAVIALDLTSGKLKWARRFTGADTWTERCNSDAGCLQPPGEDLDFASAPNLWQPANFFGLQDDHGGTASGWMLGIGQKSGVYRAINPVNGGVFWETLVGQGGIQWGSTVDLDTRQDIYVALKNDAGRLNTLTDFYGTKTPWRAGAWARLDAHTGKMIWQIPAIGNDIATPSKAAAAPAALTFSNNVVFGGATSGYFTALAGHSGYLLWKFQSGGSVYSAPAVFNDWLYWGTGYGRLGGKGYNRLYAFSFK